MSTVGRAIRDRRRGHPHLQSVGLAERSRLTCSRDLPIDFVDAKGACIMALQPQPRGNGAPDTAVPPINPRSSAYSRGVERFHTVDVRLASM